MARKSTPTPWKENGILLIFMASALFPTMGALLKYALAHVHVSQGVFFRSFVMLLILLPILKMKGLSFRGKNNLGLILRGTFGVVAMGCAFYAIAHIPLGDAAILHQTAPIFVAILSLIFLGERGGWRLGVLIVGGLVGAYLIIQSELRFYNLAGLVGLTSAALAACAYVMIKYLHKTENTWRIAVWGSLIASLVSFPFMIYFFKWPTLWEWAALIGAGTVGSVAQILMTTAYKWDKASRLSSLTYIAVIIAFIYGMIFWGEIPNYLSIIGVMVIIVCCLGVARIEFKDKEDVSVQVGSQ